MSIEPLLDPLQNRLVIYPIYHDDIWQFYKRAIGCFWTAEEIDVGADLPDFEKLTTREKDFIKNILAFFAASDAIVNENLAERFIKDVQYPEARAFYSCQIMIETIHSEVYSLLIDTLVPKIEQPKLLNAIQCIPVVQKKAEWAFKWIHNGSFAERLVAFACVEGILFSSSFAAIFWLKSRGLCIHGLGKSNEFISRDEGLHRDFAVHLYKNHLQNKLSKEKIIEIVKSSVHVEQEFVRESLPKDLHGINATSMCEYVEYVADHLLVSLGYDVIYKTPNPLNFMELISLQGKSNFFENRVTEYKFQREAMSQKLNFDAEF